MTPPPSPSSASTSPLLPSSTTPRTASLPVTPGPGRITSPSSVDKNLAAQWSPQHIVIDATGVGEGLWALLDRAFPTRVIPVKFTSQEKSEIGWQFLSIIETGRFYDPDPTDEVRIQYSHCISEILRVLPRPSVGGSPTAPADPMANLSTTTTSSPMPSPPSSTARSGILPPNLSSPKASTRWIASTSRTFQMPPMSTDFRKRYQPHRANNLRRLRAAISCTDDSCRRCERRCLHVGTLPKYGVHALSAAEGFGDKSNRRQAGIDRFDDIATHIVPFLWGSPRDEAQEHQSRHPLQIRSIWGGMGRGGGGSESETNSAAPPTLRHCPRDFVPERKGREAISSPT